MIFEQKLCTANYDYCYSAFVIIELVRDNYYNGESDFILLVPIGVLVMLETVNKRRTANVWCGPV